MKLKHNELAAVVYADLFGYPLTASEAKLWAIREVRQKNSVSKLALAQKITLWLKRIPMVEAVFLTGSVAVGNAKADADVDLMIVTQAEALWIARLVIILLLKKNHLYKTVICPNIFLDKNHLEIKEKNLYTAHEVLQAKCLYDKSNVNYLWLKKNEWTKKYLLNAFNFKIKNCKNRNSIKIENWKLKILWPLELIVFVLQYLYQLPKQTNEKLGWGYAFFHPRDLSEKVVGDLERRLRSVINLGDTHKS